MVRTREIVLKVVFILFDSLNRLHISPYGGSKVPTPNFARLQKRSATFDSHYVGSMPCMPARRDMHTGRLSFLHRSWGPLEPFDTSFAELLRNAGVYTHLVTDHYHYFEDGGSTYHNRYASYEFFRGHEKDPWHAVVEPDWAELEPKWHPKQFTRDRSSKYYPYIINRERIREESDFPAMKTFAAGVDFLERNASADNWLLQLETFSPHEPHHVPDRFKQAYRTGWNQGIRDWPPYDKVHETQEEADELRANYYASLAMCDELLGRVLDAFDTQDLWKDTVLIVSTDHGYLLGEHDFWAKNRMTLYEEIAHVPLMVAHPKQDVAGTRRNALTQVIDLAPTFLDLFGLPPCADMTGQSLLPVLAHDTPLRDALLFGYFGGAINATDGRYTYHCYPVDADKVEINQYTLMPMHLNCMFSVEELKQTTLTREFSFSKGVPILKVPVTDRSPMYFNYGPGSLIEKETRLYDLETDPKQQRPLSDVAAETKIRDRMLDLMRLNEAPPEAFERVGARSAGQLASQPAE
ncbi:MULTISPECIES: sulfatase-like hydrolase/transferase [unclassified Mesorhizobium]|uniref:sulfatase-like hydrolase/transferase n=1 Tax=unclassified Mesorhizobium TaxID=325217 RepID=UPI001FCCD494|nr:MULTISPECIES: sulfatase-like hydrolase/transferase [unclassified Mesorhizobium]